MNQKRRTDYTKEYAAHIDRLNEDYEDRVSELRASLAEIERLNQKIAELEAEIEAGRARLKARAEIGRLRSQKDAALIELLRSTIVRLELMS